MKKINFLRIPSVLIWIKCVNPCRKNFVFNGEIPATSMEEWAIAVTLQYIVR